MTEEKIEVQVTKIRQGNITAYLGKMNATDVLALYDLKKWSETEIDGYQRNLYRERQREIAKYLKECSIPIIPAILVSIRESTNFEPDNGDQGTLHIPRKRGSIMLIDGQHRMSGFHWCFEELGKREEEKRLGIEIESQAEEIKKYEEILLYDVPVLFYDSKSAADILDRGRNPDSQEIQKVVPRDVDRVIFFIVNKTQKGIRPSLKDTLQFLIYRAGIRGIPSIEKEPWRVEATEIGHKMNREGSPLAGKINLSGARGLKRPLQLNSWVSSLQPLFGNEQFKKYNRIEKYDFILAYWRIIRTLFGEEFDDNRNHLLLKSIGVYSLNWLASDICDWIRTKDEPLTEQNLTTYLNALGDFNWRSKEPNPSELRGLGGKAGVKEAYKILLKYQGNKGVEEAENTYQKIIKDEESRGRRS